MATKKVGSTTRCHNNGKENIIIRRSILKICFMLREDGLDIFFIYF